MAVEVYGLDVSVLILLSIALVVLRIFLPGILRPLRPKQQSGSTLNVLNRLKGEDIQEMTDAQFARVQWIIGQEVSVQKMKSDAQANSWMRNMFKGGQEYE